MVLKLKKLKLQPRITLTISTLILVVLMLTSYLFYYILSETVEEQIGKRALHVAKTVAAIPEIQEAFQKKIQLLLFSQSQKKFELIQKLTLL